MLVECCRVREMLLHFWDFIAFVFSQLTVFFPPALLKTVLQKVLGSSGASTVKSITGGGGRRGLLKHGAS